MTASREQLERRLGAHRRAAATHRRAKLLHGEAAKHAVLFGDEARELKERGLEAADHQGAAIEDERARPVKVALETL